MNHVLAVTLCAALALPALPPPAAAEPSAQLTRSVAVRLAGYGVDVDPDGLTTAQASALHLLLVTERKYLTIRRRAEAILRNPDFRD